MPTAPTTTIDPLLETQVFWNRHKVAILVTLLAIVIAFAGYGAYQLYASRQNAAAAQLLARAQGPADYERVISEFSGTNAAPTASLLLAAKQREARQFAEANTTLQNFLKKNPKHQLVTTAMMAMAANLDALGKTDEALAMYQRTAAEHPASFNAPLALLAQVPLLKQKGQLDQARQVAETVMTQYRESYAAAEAARLLRILKPGGGAPSAEASQAAAEAALAASMPSPGASAAPSVAAPVETAPSSAAPTP